VAAAAAAGVDGVLLAPLGGVVDGVLAGPADVAPASRPCDGCSRYVVADTFAVICGKP
jgi:hypothetical protein